MAVDKDKVLQEEVEVYEIEDESTAAEEKRTLSLSLQHENEKQNIELRKKLVRWVKWLVSTYLGAVVLLLYVQLYFHPFHPLSDTTIVVLLTTTTANVLGISYLVVRNLFPSESSKE